MVTDHYVSGLNHLAKWHEILNLAPKSRAEEAAGLAYTGSGWLCFWRSVALKRDCRVEWNRREEGVAASALTASLPSPTTPASLLLHGQGIGNSDHEMHGISIFVFCKSMKLCKIYQYKVDSGSFPPKYGRNDLKEYPESTQSEYSHHARQNPKAEI